MRIAFSLTVAVLAATPAFAATPISSCSQMTTAGVTYVLTQDTGSCGMISNVTLDCAGHRVGPFGDIVGTSGFTIRNCVVDLPCQWSSFRTWANNDVTLEGNTFRNACMWTGYNAPTMKRLVVRNNTFINTKYFVGFCDDCVIEGNTFSGGLPSKVGASYDQLRDSPNDARTWWMERHYYLDGWGANVTVRNNTFTDSGSGDPEGGVQWDGSGLVTGNVINAMRLPSVYALGAGLAVTNNAIDGALIGVQATFGSSGVSIAGNTMRNLSAFGILDEGSGTSIGSNSFTAVATALCHGDRDRDRACDDVDNCVRLSKMTESYNPGQADADTDGAGDTCDNCASTGNPDQGDANGDGDGDACQPAVSIDSIHGGGAGGVLGVEATVAEPNGDAVYGSVSVASGFSETLFPNEGGSVDGLGFCYAFGSYLMNPQWGYCPGVNGNTRFAMSWMPLDCATWNAGGRSSSRDYVDLQQMTWSGPAPWTICVIDGSNPDHHSDMTITSWSWNSPLIYGAGVTLLAQAWSGALPTSIALAALAGHAGESLTLNITANDGDTAEAEASAQFTYSGESLLVFAGAGDSDGDGIDDVEDACPAENAAGHDADHDGCGDAAAALAALVSELPLSPQTAGALIAHAQSAAASAAAGNVTAAANKLAAFVNAVKAGARSGRIDAATAALLVAFAQNASASL